MKQLLILSGKGGTGKTTVAAALIKLFAAKAYADCDVDAPNLHLVTEQKTQPLVQDYFGLDTALIDQDLCDKCGLCMQKCRFNAIFVKRGSYFVDRVACEGCSVCEYVCPQKAISMHKRLAGEMMLYQNGHVFSTAKLKMGNGTSGKLVYEVKKQLIAAASNAKTAIIDGSPGIGCPVIASLSGVDLAVIVTEPSISGLHDMKRIVETAINMNVPVVAIINKCDTNSAITGKITTYLKQKNIALLGNIPYDSSVVDAVNQNRSIMDIDCVAKYAMEKIYHNLYQVLEGK